MRRSKPESFCLNCEAGIAERRSGLLLQPHESFGQTLIPANSHLRQMGHKVAVGEEQLGGEDLCPDFQTLVQVGLVTIRDAEIAVAKEVFELVGHCENHRISWQAFGQHDRRTEMVINKRASQMSESIRPFVNCDSVLRVNPHQVVGENAW